ncbi:hypothetical protein ABZ832_10585 [Streptantibioticus parmotrematis]|uniref:hypothetical protein n=1 Tax=Streptantibioticus parmotrematis TaxID=2873249 RepID=UPI0033F70506
MTTSTSGTRTAVESFPMGAAFASVRVDSEISGVHAETRERCSPLFSFDDFPHEPRVTVRVSRTERLEVPADTWRHRDETPVLDLDASRFLVAEFGSRYALLEPGDGDAAPMAVLGERGGRHVEIQVTEDSPAARRAVARHLRFLMGAQLTSAGLPALHGSAVAADGRAVMVLGSRGSGKSSLMLLATTLLGWRFVSDDVILPYRDPASGEPRVIGLPKRIGVSVAALDGHRARERFEQTPLRGHGGAPGRLDLDPARPWGAEHRVRLHCDLGEFLAITGAQAASDARPAGVVLPVARREERGWRIERLAPGETGWLTEHRARTRQLKYVTDFLGLLPQDRPTGVADVLPALRALPVVRVVYGADVNRDFARFWGEVTAALGCAEPLPEPSGRPV